MNWELYNESLTVQGETRRDRVIAQTQRIINRRTVNSPAYKRVMIDGVSQNVVITSSTEFYHKKINALPNEQIYAGGIVEWNNKHFIITGTDVEDEIYQRGEMYQCNVYLKWQNEKGKIIGRYGYSEDLSQFATGIVESKVMMNIEQVFRIQFPVDEETIKLRRDKRFLMDIVSDEPNAYVLTNRNVINANYSPTDISYDEDEEAPEFDGRNKILMLTLSQTQLSEKDNCHLMIADYVEPSMIGEQAVTNGTCSIIYTGQPTIKVGGSNKKFSVEFTDSDGNSLNLSPVWSVTALPKFENKFTITQEENWIKIKADNDLNMIGSQILLKVSDSEGDYEAELYVKVVSLYG